MEKVTEPIVRFVVNVTNEGSVQLFRMMGHCCAKEIKIERWFEISVE